MTNGNSSDIRDKRLLHYPSHVVTIANMLEETVDRIFDNKCLTGLDLKFLSGFPKFAQLYTAKIRDKWGEGSASSWLLLRSILDTLAIYPCGELEYEQMATAFNMLNTERGKFLINRLGMHQKAGLLQPQMSLEA